MKIGETIKAKTHAEFLNSVLGTQYKQWMRAGYNLNYTEMLWFVHFDNTNRSGWANYIEKDRIIEKNLYGTDTWDGCSIAEICRRTRITFSIQEDIYGNRIYKYIGIYQYDKTNSNLLNNHIWNKVSDEWIK